MIRDAVPSDCERLTYISFKSKSFWNYPEEYMSLWKNELTITEQYLKDKIVRVYIFENEVIGFLSIVNIPELVYFGNVFLETGYWLDHMFILPYFHKRGFGKQFFRDIDNLSTNGKISDTIKIFVDPNAIGFYSKIGAKQIRISESSIPSRNIPVMEYIINRHEK